MIPYWKQHINRDDIHSIIKTLESDYLTTWPNVKKFEDNLCQYTWAKYSIVCWNWTQALHLAYMAIWLKKWDEVITTANTFVATSNMAIACWAKVTFCDIKLDWTYNINEEEIEKLINKNTKAIVPVHFSWNPCNMNKIWTIAKKYKLKVIEDWAHALWAEYKWNKIWNLNSDLTTFSFHPVKPITTWEWWAILTNNKELYEKVILLRSHWIIKDKNWFNDMVSFWYNYRITDIQCALWISQLEKINKFISYRNKIANLYNQYLWWIKWISLPVENIWNKSWWHLYVVRFENIETRDKIMYKLRKEWYWVTLHYPPIYSNTYYKKKWYWNVKCPLAERYFNTCLSLPIFYWIQEKEIETITKLIINNIE